LLDSAGVSRTDDVELVAGGRGAAAVQHVVTKRDRVVAGVAVVIGRIDRRNGKAKIFVDGGPVTLPAGMSPADAAERWSAICDGFDVWLVDVVTEPAREGAGHCPPDGTRPSDAPGARWITKSDRG
jgi:hypothetical protein